VRFWVGVVCSGLGVVELVSCDAKTLLRRFVRMEYVWRLHGDTLPTVRFEDDSMVIPNYFGRDFRVPLNMELVSPPSIYLKAYPYECGR
jgi:hypothetical protein